MNKHIFTLTEHGKPVEGWSDDILRNGYETPFFTAENLREVFHPYPVTFGFTEDCIPMATIKTEDETIIIESSPVWDGNDFIVGFSPDGFEFLRTK